MFPIIESWQHSGQSKRAYCETQGITEAVFFYWSKRYREENEQGGFVSLTTGSPHSFAQIHFIEVQYPNGVILRLPANTPASQVRQYAGQ